MVEDLELVEGWFAESGLDVSLAQVLPQEVLESPICGRWITAIACGEEWAIFAFKNFVGTCYACITELGKEAAIEELQRRAPNDFEWLGRENGNSDGPQIVQHYFLGDDLQMRELDDEEKTKVGINDELLAKQVEEAREFLKTNPDGAVIQVGGCGPLKGGYVYMLRQGEGGLQGLAIFVPELPMGMQRMIRDGSNLNIFKEVAEAVRKLNPDLSKSEAGRNYLRELDGYARESDTDGIVELGISRRRGRKWDVGWQLEAALFGWLVMNEHQEVVAASVPLVWEHEWQTNGVEIPAQKIPEEGDSGGGASVDGLDGGSDHPAKTPLSGINGASREFSSVLAVDSARPVAIPPLRDLLFGVPSVIREAPKDDSGQKTLKPQKKQNFSSLEQVVFEAETVQQEQKQDSDKGDEGSGGAIGGGNGSGSLPTDSFSGGGLKRQSVTHERILLKGVSLPLLSLRANEMSVAIPNEHEDIPMDFRLMRNLSIQSVPEIDELVVEERIESMVGRRDAPKRILLKGVSLQEQVVENYVEAHQTELDDLEDTVRMESGVYVPKVLVMERLADAVMGKIKQIIKNMHNMHYGLVWYMAILILVDQLNAAIALLEKEAEKIVEIPKVEIVRPKWRLGPQRIDADKWTELERSTISRSLITEIYERERGVARKLEKSARNYAFLWKEANDIVFTS